MKYTANFSFRVGSQSLPECKEIEFKAKSLAAAKRAAKAHAAAQRDDKGNPWRLLDVWETGQDNVADVQAWADAIAEMKTTLWREAGQNRRLTMLKITDIAVMHDTKEIIAVGTGFCDLLKNADAAGVWDKKPGSGAPYFCTSAESKEFFGAWYRKGFWDDHDPDGTRKSA